MLTRLTRQICLKSNKNINKNNISLIGTIGTIQNRNIFSGITRSGLTGQGGYYVTKYKIVKPGREGTDWDDFMLSLPEKDELATISKENQLFLKYLKVVTDQENRQEDFKNFMTRASNGLQVESDVFISTNELLSIMWKNGYSDKERTALQFTFPADYRFHYPELAVLFDVSEEDAYKFCMRKRIEESHIGELKSDRESAEASFRDHWLVFGVSALIFKSFPFFSYYFILKGFGTGLWFLTMWNFTNRYFHKVISRNDYMNQQKVAQELMNGEDKIMEAMQRFGNDSKCLDSLKSIQSDVKDSMSKYRKALLENEKNELIIKTERKLKEIATYENNINSKLQASIVAEVENDFKEKFSKSTEMQNQALTSAIESLSGTPSKNDPVINFFSKTIESIDLSGKAKANPTGTVSEKLAYLEETSEKEFINQFYITKDEVAEVKSAGNDENKLETIMSKIYSKSGYHLPTMYKADDLSTTGDSKTDSFVSEVNAAKNKILAEVKKQNLANFQSSFA